jgi:NADH dehydrogenase FAD-containing subunit
VLLFDGGDAPLAAFGPALSAKAAATLARLGVEQYMNTIVTRVDASAAYISRGKAVVSVGRLHLSGFLAWWIWLFIHIGFLTGYRNRLGAVMGWWFAFTRDLRRERTFTTKEVGFVPDVYTARVPAPRPRPQHRPSPCH